MQIYFYCSYERSLQGYFMTRVENGTLVPQSLDELPTLVNEFFSVDRFQVLWKDISPEDASWLKPTVCGSFFGMRNIRGMLGAERAGIVNIAFYAQEEERQLLNRVALCILQDVAQFRSLLMQCLSVGGPCSYQLDGQLFDSWLQSCMRKQKMRLNQPNKHPVYKILPDLQRTEPPLFETELLRLAVLESAWKDVRSFFRKGLIWRVCPRNALSIQEFERIFLGSGPLWEMLDQQ